MSLKETQVFTPPWATNQMLDMLDESCFAESSSYFFEPSCGNGEMLVVILERIYAKLLDKYAGDVSRALSETCFKFYAIELDPILVVECREKIFRFFFDKCASIEDYKIFSFYLIAQNLQDKIQNKDFFKLMTGKERP